MSNQTRYSESCPMHLRSFVPRIGDAGADFFRTDAFAEGGASLWLEAWKSPEDSLWRVREVRRLETGDTGVTERQPALGASCFFDALYFCADFEVLKKSSNEPSVLPAKTAGRPHFSRVAQNAGVPLDLEGLPLLAAGGEIINDDAAYDDAAAAVAENSLPLAKVPAALTVRADIAPVLKDVGSALTVFDAAARQEQAVQAHLGALHAQGIRDCFNDAVLWGEAALKAFSCAIASGFNGYNFLDLHKQRKYFESDSKKFVAFGTTLGGILTLGIRPAYFYWNYSSEMYPERDFNRSLKKTESLASSLPEGDAKKALLEFTAAARGAFAMEKARAMYMQHKENPKDMPLPKVLRQVDAGTALYGLPAPDCESVRRAYMDGKIPERCYYYRKAEQRLRDLKLK